MKTSIVVTVLNEEKSIERLCKALLSQTQKCDDIIIVDGGSVDNTVSIIKKFPKIKLFQKIGNRSVGRNFGIEKAKESIIAITDAGGYLQKDWLEKITQPFKDNKVEVVSGYYKSLAETNFEKCITPYFLVMPDQLSKVDEFFPSSRSVAIRKTVWEKVKYPEKYFHNEDLVWDYDLKKAGYDFYFQKNAIVYWQPQPNLKVAIRTFYRFALGDAEADIYRPTAQFIYYRYLGALFLFGMGKYSLVLIPLFILYSLWAILKNIKYVKSWQAIYWLPIIQIASDVSIMWGHLVGKMKK
jgi:glycosyltransferase involved in cell wall biosynthesis